MSAIPAGVVLSAAAALTSGQEQFTAHQVAVLIHLAYESGRAAGYEQGVDDEQASMFDGLKRAFGGPSAATMREAVAIHIKAVDQLNARRASDRAARLPRPLSIVTDDPDWPTVTVPGAAHLNRTNRRVA